jgi:hypothetical protein
MARLRAASLVDPVDGTISARQRGVDGAPAAISACLEHMFHFTDGAKADRRTAQPQHVGTKVP